MTKTIAIPAIIALACAGSAIAQDPSAAPTYGDVSLSAGFTPDPFTVDLRSGGPIDVSETIGGSCRGFIASRPDFDLYYNAGTFPLIISVDANSDTTLVVNAPDGSWYCDDDSGEGLNPSIRFAQPQSGLYDIWVGTYGNADLEPARLHISELQSE